ncbi:unnamed protein product [Porites evermanni]|uniref:Uncharacterized protein n=1 Tax=Porites evermanni TaxID=104178 RepID=A0ABN8SNH9_9CNID|nr:unnamed protein product [Porites evermanni]
MGVYLLIIAFKDVQWQGEYFKHDVNWRSGLTCAFTGVLSMASSEISVLMLTLITTDRLICIVFPFKMRRINRKRSFIIVGGIWIFGTMISIIPTLGFDYFFDKKREVGFYGKSAVCLPLQLSTERHAGWEYAVGIFIILNFVSFMYILTAYTAMYLRVKGSAKQVRSTNTKRESKMAKRMMLIVLTDFLCWMPIIVIGLLSLLGKFHDPEKQAYVWIAVFVLPVNSALNPILYTFSTPRVKRKVGEHIDSLISFLKRTMRRPKTTQGMLLGSLFNKQRSKWKGVLLKPLLTTNPNKSNRKPDEILERERPESALKLVEIPGIFADETSLSVGFVVACSGSEENSCVRLIKHFSKIKEEDWKKEVELAKELRQGLEHPSIIKYCWHSETEKSVVNYKKAGEFPRFKKSSFLLCFDFSANTTLEEYLISDGIVLNLDSLIAVAMDLISAIQHLEQKCVVHNNITTSSVLIGKGFRVPPITAVLGSFGFAQRNGMMVGSDVVIGWVKDSKGYLTDRYADAKSLPPKDNEQNYILTGFEEIDETTVLKFNRKFDTCDSRDRKIKEGTTKVVFAYQTEDPETENDFKQHTFRGSRSILLLNNMDKKQINETGWKSFVIQNKNVTIPKKHTTYWCSLIKAPKITSQHHITKIEPYIQKGNEGFVHHFLVYECHGDYNESHYGFGVDRKDIANMPFLKCFYGKVLAVWGVGGEAFYYPKNAGFPIGTVDTPKSYLLEIHYDNPEGIMGRKDSSGARFYYSSNLREFDAGIFAVGLKISPYMVIPPKQESWLTVGYCAKECSEKAFSSTKLPGRGIRAFAAFLHTHLQGRATWTKHYRNGVELPEIARDDNYDFNFQDIQVLKKEVHIKPGDDLVHFCEYQTMDRDKLVVGGSATSQEMCLNFIFYYPLVKELKTSCTSTQFKPVHDFINKYYPSLNITSPFHNPLAEDEDISWTKEMISSLKKGYSEDRTFTPTCYMRGNKPPFKTLPVPKITTPLPEQESRCSHPFPKSAGKNTSSTLVVSCSVALFISVIFML